uniref:Uncharacterized protein n=1 Tax=Oryza punctata TaxID=4537 RepID=A0A0E0KPT2_ORYPU
MRLKPNPTMRRLPKSLLLASLSKPFLRCNRESLPLPLLRPPPHHLLRVLSFAARTLTAPAAPPPEVVLAAQSDGLEFLEAAELWEAADDHHQEGFALAIKALELLQASHGGWSRPVQQDGIPQSDGCPKIQETIALIQQLLAVSSIYLKYSRFPKVKTPDIDNTLEDMICECSTWKSNYQVAATLKIPKPCKHKCIIR